MNIIERIEALYERQLEWRDRLQFIDVYGKKSQQEVDRINENIDRIEKQIEKLARDNNITLEKDTTHGIDDYITRAKKAGFI
jgi:archaellum component FlaC